MPADARDEVRSARIEHARAGARGEAREPLVGLMACYLFAERYPPWLTALPKP